MLVTCVQFLILVLYCHFIHVVVTLLLFIYLFLLILLFMLRRFLDLVRKTQQNVLLHYSVRIIKNTFYKQNTILINEQKETILIAFFAIKQFIFRLGLILLRKKINRFSFILFLILLRKEYFSLIEIDQCVQSFWNDLCMAILLCEIFLA